MPIKFKGDLDFTRTRMFLEKLKGLVHSSFFDKYGKIGVEALAAGTPKKNTTTANAWYYKVTMKGNRACINFYNSNIQNGVCVAILLEYGHGTRNGGWVEGRKYIEPSIQPVFDQMLQEITSEVKR
jgi:hypothetical protein